MATLHNRTIVVYSYPHTHAIDKPLYVLINRNGKKDKGKENQIESCMQVVVIGMPMANCWTGHIKTAIAKHDVFFFLLSSKCVAMVKNIFLGVASRSPIIFFFFPRCCCCYFFVLVVVSNIFSLCKIDENLIPIEKKTKKLPWRKDRKAIKMDLKCR